MKRRSRNAIAIFLSGGVNLLLFYCLPLLNRNEMTVQAASPVISVVRRPILNHTAEPEIELESNASPKAVVSESSVVEFEFPQQQVIPFSLPATELQLSTPDVMIGQVNKADLSRVLPYSQGGTSGLYPKVLHAESVTEPPRDLQNKAPPYPQTARRQNAEGRVTIRILIDENGHVQQAKILEHVGHSSFRGAVRKTVPQWRFTPPRHHGKPARVWCVREIEFKLDL